MEKRKYGGQEAWKGEKKENIQEKQIRKKLKCNIFILFSYKSLMAPTVEFVPPAVYLDVLNS